MLPVFVLFQWGGFALFVSKKRDRFPIRDKVAFWYFWSRKSTPRFSAEKETFTGDRSRQPSSFYEKKQVRDCAARFFSAFLSKKSAQSAKNPPSLSGFFIIISSSDCKCLS